MIILFGLSVIDIAVKTLYYYTNVVIQMQYSLFHSIQDIMYSRTVYEQPTVTSTKVSTTTLLCLFEV